VKLHRVFVSDEPRGEPMSGHGKNHRLRNRIAKALRRSPDRVRVIDPKRTDDKDQPA
jgi:hypothetical protein